MSDKPLSKSQQRRLLIQTGEPTPEGSFLRVLDQPIAGYQVNLGPNDAIAIVPGGINIDLGPIESAALLGAVSVLVDKVSEMDAKLDAFIERQERGGR